MYIYKNTTENLRLGCVLFKIKILIVYKQSIVLDEPNSHHFFSLLLTNKKVRAILYSQKHNRGAVVMISIEGDKLGVVKGLPPKGYIYPEGVLLGCDDNIGATVTAFLRCCAIGYLWGSRPSARYLIVPCFFISKF